MRTSTPDIYCKNIQNFIRYKRKEQKLSQEELAKKAGMARPTLAALELYGSNMTVNKVFSLFKALNTSLIEVQFFIDRDTKEGTIRCTGCKEAWDFRELVCCVTKRGRHSYLCSGCFQLHVKDKKIAGQNG